MVIFDLSWLRTRTSGMPPQPKSATSALKVPQTPDDWLCAVNAAGLSLLLTAACVYGFAQSSALNAGEHPA